MREPYIPIFCSITQSTLWSADAAVCKVYITMLAMADPEGYVASSVDGIAALARLPLEEVDKALAELMAPDPRSRSKTDSGRRVFEVPRGWHIPALPVFRALARKESEKARKREWARANNSGRPTSASATARPTETETETETETDPEPEKSAKRTKRGPLWHFVPETWKPVGKVLSDTQTILGRRFDAELARFREWEFRDGKSDADRAWRRWARTAAESGNAQRGALAPRGGPESTHGGWRPDVRHRTLLEGILASLSKRGIDHPHWNVDSLAGDFMRSGALGALAGDEADKAFARFIREKVGAK